MEKRHHIHISLSALVLILTYNNARAMLSVGDKTCHCTLLKRGKDNFYIRIKSTAENLFPYGITTNNPYLGIASMLFPSPMIFTFDSALMDKYTEEIDKTIESNLKDVASTYNRATKGFRENILLRQELTLKDTLKKGLDDFKNEIKTKIIDNMQQFPTLKIGLQDIFKDELLSISNQIEDKDKKLKISISDAEAIANSLAEFLQQGGELFLQEKPASGNIKQFIQYLIEHKDIIRELLPTLLFSQNNTILNLAQDNLMTRPFRFIYHNVQRLGSACNVEVAPIDPLVTRNLILNRYAISTFIGASAIGIWAKWGLPKISWPTANAGK